MKSYKFTTKEGQEFKVRFYPTGCYTVVDKNGEHEVGEWFKEQQFINVEYGIRRKDKNAVYFEYREFGKKKSRAYSYLKDMAHTIVNEWYYNHKD